MMKKSLLLEWWRRTLVCLSLFALLSNNFYAFGQSSRVEKSGDDGKKTQIKTETPIKHVIVLIGENRTFDHLFATYQPKHGESISNLLSKGIINANGGPGPNFALAQQFQAVAPFRTDFFISYAGADRAWAEWVAWQLTDGSSGGPIDSTCDRLAVTAKGISAVETYLQARFNMYRHVYFHKVVRSAEGASQAALAAR